MVKPQGYRTRVSPLGPVGFKAYMGYLKVKYQRIPREGKGDAFLPVLFVLSHRQSPVLRMVDTYGRGLVRYTDMGGKPKDQKRFCSACSI